MNCAVPFCLPRMHTQPLEYNCGWHTLPPPSGGEWRSLVRGEAPVWPVESRREQAGSSVADCAAGCQATHPARVLHAELHATAFNIVVHHGVASLHVLKGCSRVNVIH